MRLKRSDALGIVVQVLLLDMIMNETNLNENIIQIGHVFILDERTPTLAPRASRPRALPLAAERLPPTATLPRGACPCRARRGRGGPRARGVCARAAVARKRAGLEVGIPPPLGGVRFLSALGEA